MSQTGAIVDKLLTSVSDAFDPVGFLSEKLLPTIPVKQNTGLLGKYGKDFLRVENTVMGGQGMARRVITNTRSSTGYIVEDHGLEGLVTESDRRNVEKPFDAEKDEVIGFSTK